MRSILVILCVLVIAAAAGGFDLGARQAEKAPREWPVNVPLEGRQGGDTVLDAVLVPVLPFETVGTTSGFNDDYDEACPYGGSTAPDVVYTLVPDNDQAIDIDMAGSAYDTKIYLYDENLTLIACNDDFYPDFVSKLEDVEVAAGVQYFLIIDGYGTEHGEYTLRIASSGPPCVVLPGCYAMVEDEPPLIDGYVDTYNGGCNSEEYGAPVMTIPTPDTQWGTEFAGSSGWYLADGTVHRDTDWLRTTMPGDGSFEVTVMTEQPVYLFQILPTECPGADVYQSVAVDPCEPGSMHITGTPGEEIWLWVGPRDFPAPDDIPEGEFRYRLGLGPGSMYGSCLDLGPQSDYSHGCTGLVLEDYRADFSTGSCADDVDLAELCGAAYATPGGDVMASVYLEAGGHVSFQWHPYYYEPLDGERYYTCLALVDDLRPDRRSCVEATCVAGINQWDALSVAQPGWYWFVVDVSVEGATSEWGNIGVYGLGAPPVPPAHDGCEGAIPLPVGAFAFEDDLSDATNRFDPGRDGCPGAADVIFTSRDVVYEVALDHGQTLDVVMSGMNGWDAQLYLVRDCEDPAGNCVVAGEPEGGDLHLTYTALDDELLWLVCDSYGNGPRPFTLTGSIETTTDAPPVAPAQLAVIAAPNPFNPATQITYDLPRAGRASLRVYALDGRLVRTLVDDDRTAGRHVESWGGRDRRGRAVASGAYILRLDAGGETRSTRLLLLK